MNKTILYALVMVAGITVGLALYPKPAQANLRWTTWSQCQNRIGHTGQWQFRTCLFTGNQNHCKDWLDVDWRQCAVPTPTLAPTPTPDPCSPNDELKVADLVSVDCITPTPEVTPEPTRTPEQPLSDAPAGPAPSCSEPAPAVQPWNFLVVRNGTEADLRWIPGDGSVIDVFYTEVGLPGWPFAWTGENTGHTVIGGLDARKGYTFTIRGRNPCSDGKFISPVVVDGAYDHTFLTTYWLVW